MRRERKKKILHLRQNLPMEGGPSPLSLGHAECWFAAEPDQGKKLTIQPHHLIFLFLVREILIWLLPDKDRVETLHKDMCPEVQFLNTSKHLWEEIKLPKNAKNKFLWVLEEVMRKRYCALKVFQNLLTKLINYTHGFWCNLYCITLKTASCLKVAFRQTSVTYQTPNSSKIVQCSYKKYQNIFLIDFLLSN